MRKILITAAALVVAGAAFAHTGVKNPAVKARMDAMSAIGAEMKVLGQMAKGGMDFDASKAKGAAGEIARLSSEINALFEAEESDPKSEALPAIWQNFSDFSAKSDALQVAAELASGNIATMDDLKAALGSIGATCGACHKAYRAKK